MSLHRRDFLKLAGGLAAGAVLPPALARALSIPAKVRTGTLMDVEHVVILMQENRSFDHYFGTLPGVRGFGDRFTIPQFGGQPVWVQRNRSLQQMTPYHLDQSAGNAQRVSGTPHGWEDGHLAWNEGRYGAWPLIKEPQSMGYYKEAELPFQFALANSFTICDAYHCSVLSSTNPNRLFLFSGWNDPKGSGGGPATDNTNDDLGPPETGFTWTTYAELLEAAGVSWKVYQDMNDNFTDNSLEGFKTFREAYNNSPESPLVTRGLSTTLTNNSLDGLRDDVLAGKLPQVSYVVGPAGYSEHTGPSSPVQGGWYTQSVIEALTADPEVWSKTVLLVMFDENDGFFDHMPPPCAPSIGLDGAPAGGSTVDDSTERQGSQRLYDNNWVFGPGIRVPMYVISPWSRGGWVNSQVFDHGSINQFLEQRFGVVNPNVTPWRRAVCGDLTSCFNFANPNDEPFPDLPKRSKEAADQLRSEQEAQAQIAPPSGIPLPVQAAGIRPSRALPYELHVGSEVGPAQITLTFSNTGAQGAVFHVYNRNDLLGLPRRYTVEAGKQLRGHWTVAAGGYDLWVLGPNGFHRHFTGNGMALGQSADVSACYDIANGNLHLTLKNPGSAAVDFSLRANAYYATTAQVHNVPAGGSLELPLPLKESGHWYDFTVSVGGISRRFAGRVETGKHGISDPAMGATV